MARIVLAGAFGQRNPGDDALLDAFAQALAGHEIIATSSAPATSVPGCDVVAPGDPTAVMRRVRAADAVVFAGGTIFKELRPATGRAPMDLLARALAMGFGTRALGKQLALVGVGAAPLRRGRSRLLACWCCATRSQPACSSTPARPRRFASGRTPPGRCWTASSRSRPARATR
jgi:polysaccharide pyruvyl transferase WcaK-like protein